MRFTWRQKGRMLALVAVSLICGLVWDMGWGPTLPFAALAFPVLIAYLIAKLFPECSVSEKLAVVLLSVVANNVVSVSIYAVNGGAGYLLHEFETQLVIGMLMVWQALLTLLLLGGSALIRRLRRRPDNQESGSA